MNILGNEFEMAAGDFTLEMEIDLALEKMEIDHALDIINPCSVSYVRTNKQSGTKYILIRISNSSNVFTIDTGEKVISFEDVWPEIQLRVVFS